MGHPCEHCPWISTAKRDKDALTDEIKRCAANGNWFCCHVHMGTCFGALRFSKSKAAGKYKDGPTLSTPDKS